MERRESERTEFKASVTEDIRKEIIAFANGNGGQLYVGISDDGNIVGVDNPDETALQISNMVRDSIKPDVTLFVHYETREEAGKKYMCGHSAGNGPTLLSGKERDSSGGRLCKAGLFLGSGDRCGHPSYD